MRHIRDYQIPWWNGVLAHPCSSTTDNAYL
jgi:hypothetical protein